MTWPSLCSPTTRRGPGGRDRGRDYARSGAAADAICDVAAEINADLIIVGNKGMVGVRRVLGSVPNSVAHKAPCSVLIADTT